ncbi:hypothetical protein ACOSQ3_001909 [Xanthoceras sorbifolium]
MCPTKHSNGRHYMPPPPYMILPPCPPTLDILRPPYTAPLSPPLSRRRPSPLPQISPHIRDSGLFSGNNNSMDSNNNTRHHQPAEERTVNVAMFEQLQQSGGRSVQEYVDEFYRLSARNDLQESEDLIEKFVGGLRAEIREKVALRFDHTESEATTCDSSLGDDEDESCNGCGQTSDKTSSIEEDAASSTVSSTLAREGFFMGYYKKIVLST